jgi:signal peptidase I
MTWYELLAGLGVISVGLYLLGWKGLNLIAYYQIPPDTYSMFPTLLPGDILLTYRPWHPYRVNELVVFERQGQILVKRVAGIVGDTVFGTTVPHGYVYVLGDNPDKSEDSRQFGVIPVGVIKGKIWHIQRGRNCYEPTRIC